MRNKRLKIFMIILSIFLFYGTTQASAPAIPKTLDDARQQVDFYLERSLSNTISYKIWKLNNSYTGSWRSENGIVLGYTGPNLSEQSINSLSDDASNYFDGSSVKLQNVQDGISWGEGNKIILFLTIAMNSDLLPHTAAYYSEEKSEVVIGTLDKDIQENFINILKSEGFSISRVTFRYIPSILGR